MEKDYGHDFKRLKKAFFLVTIFILLIFLVWYNYHYYADKYIKNEVLTTKQVENIKESRMEYKKNIELYFDKKIIPYASKDNFYLLYVNSANDYKKIYTLSDFKIAIKDIENNHTIHLLLYNKNYYKEVDVELTNIPVMYISDVNDLLLYGFGNEIYDYNCVYDQRGSFSLSSDKKSYKLDIYNKRNKKLKLALLGMNTNDSWILNPIFFDNSYIREKLSYDVWDNLSEDFNHGLEYVEFILDDEYQGIYYLQEPVTINTFDGNLKNDMLFSVKANFAKDKSSLDAASIIEHFEVENNLENNKRQRKLLESFGKLVYNEEDDMELDIKYDLDNATNYYLFIILTMAKDNDYKNQKILLREKDGYYLLQKTAWDLDWTFTNEKILTIYPETNFLSSSIDEDYTITKKFKDTTFINIVKKKYFKIKEEFYNMDNLNNLIDEYVSYLNKYGAIERDAKKWKNLSFEESIENIKTAIEKRIKYLDKYYGE